AFGLTRSFDPDDPVWHTYVQGLGSTVNALDWTEQFFLTHFRPWGSLDPFGCFRYNYEMETATIRIHFAAGDTSRSSVLSKEYVAERMAELQSMFGTIRQRHPEARRVRGNSWLYNIEAYRRLYPPAFSAVLSPAGYEFQFLALWGQFLHRTGELRQPAADVFLACVEQQTTMAGVERCFPYQMLKTACDIQEFYRWYGV
nr:hypothetical protein [Herpetosiphonaceae bacterium]